jgi:TP901 family phage tail tape measure protein
MADIKIKVLLEGGQFKGEIGDIENAVNEVDGRVSAQFDNMTSKVTAFSFSFNQISDSVKKVINTIEPFFDTYKQYESAIANVASLGVDNINQLSSAVMATASETPVALGNLTSGLYDVVSAGVDAANQIYVLDASARAAKAGLAETSDALNLSSAIIKAYGKDWTETEQVLDQAFQTVKLGQTTFRELASSIGTAAPLAATMKISTQELFGAMATLTGVTGGAAEVSTQLRAIMAGLAAPTDALKEIIEEHTGTTVENAVAQEGLAGILEIVQKATGGSATKMNELFGRIEAVNAVLALSGPQFQTFREKTDAMTESTGAMNEAFAIQADTLESKIQLMQNNIDILTITLLTGLVPAINAVLNTGVGFLQWLNDSSSEVDKLQKGFTELNQQMADVDNIQSLINEYDELINKTERNADENDRLREIIDKLKDAYPGAVTEIDNYGRALAINTDAIERQIRAERERLKQLESGIYKSAVDELQKHLNIITETPGKVERTAKMTEELNNQMRFSATNMAAFSMQSNAINKNFESFEKILTDANRQLPITLDLLSNYVNLETPEKIRQFGESIGLSDQDIGIIIANLIKVDEKIEEIFPGQGEGTVKKIIIRPVLPDVPLDFDADEILPDEIFKTFEQQLQYDLRLLELFHENRMVTEEEYYTRKRELLISATEYYDFNREDEIEKHLEYNAKRLSLEQEYADKKAQIDQIVLSTTLGTFSSLMSAFQGQNETMFNIGKNAAAANTVVNAYAAATAAYKAMAGIPVVGPALGTAAAVAAVLAGLGNANRIMQTQYKAKKQGGMLDDTGRVIGAGDYGSGENRIFIANSGEYLINAAAVNKYGSIIDAINSEASPGVIARMLAHQAATMQTGGIIIDNVSKPAYHNTVTPGGALTATIDPAGVFDLINAIKEINININQVLDGQQFLKENYPEYEKREKLSRIA